MTIDPSIILGLKQPEYQSPINALGNALALQGQMRQNELGGLQLQQARVDAQDAAGLRNYLQSNPNLSTPEGQAGLYKAAPTKAAGVIKSQLDAQKSAADLKKTEVETEGFKLKQKHDAVAFNLQALGAINDPSQIPAWYEGGVRSGLITPEQAQRSMAQVPNDPQGFVAWKQQQMQAGMTVSQQLEQALKQQQFWLDQQKFGEVKRHNKAEEGLTAQGQNITIRGQNMTDARARELNAITNSGNSVKNENELRKEFEALPEVKSYKQAYPSYAGIVDAAKRSTPAADINIVYGLAKLYDPNSVVREGEYATVANSPNIPDRIKGYAQYLAGGGRLDDNTKKQILQEAQSRINTYGNEFEKAANTYSGIAGDRGIDLTKVLQAAGEFDAGGKRKAQAPTPTPGLPSMSDIEAEIARRKKGK